MKSTAVVELLEFVIQAFGTILQHFQGPVLMLRASSILSIASPSVAKNMSPSADSFTTMSRTPRPDDPMAPPFSDSNRTTLLFASEIFLYVELKLLFPAVENPSVVPTDLLL